MSKYFEYRLEKPRSELTRRPGQQCQIKAQFKTTEMSIRLRDQEQTNMEVFNEMVCEALWCCMTQPLAVLAQLMWCRLCFKFFRYDDLRVEYLALHKETFDWAHTSVRGIIVNPLGGELAILRHDDTVLLQTPFKKAPEVLDWQRHEGLSCGAFRPWSQPSVFLAVGGLGGVSVWHHGDPWLNPVWLQLHSGAGTGVDFVLNVQWVNDGSHLACALLFRRCIQIVDVERRQVLQQLDTLRADSHLWLFSDTIGGILKLFDLLNVQDKHLTYRTLAVWERQMSEGCIIQAACWLSYGCSLIYTLWQDSRVFMCTPHPQHAVFLRPSDHTWSKDMLIDLSVIVCDNGSWIDEEECGEIQAMSIDPCGVYLAVVFQRRPFVLLCTVSVPTISCRAKVRPKRFIRSFDNRINASCITFGRIWNWQVQLFIGWTSGFVEVTLLELPPATKKRNKVQRMDVN